MAKVSAGLLPVLGVPSALGRWILEEDDRPGAPPVVVLGHALWQRQFGACYLPARAATRVDPAVTLRST